MFMTIVRVLLPKSSWKHKEGAILKGASRVPQNCRMETTAFSGTTSREKLKVRYKDNREAQQICGVFLKKIKTNKKAQKSETKRRYIRIEKGGYYVSDQTLLLTAQMVNS